MGDNDDPKDLELAARALLYAATLRDLGMLVRAGHGHEMQRTALADQPLGTARELLDKMVAALDDATSHERNATADEKAPLVQKELASIFREVKARRRAKASDLAAALVVDLRKMAERFALTLEDDAIEEVRRGPMDRVLRGTGTPAKAATEATQILMRRKYGFIGERAIEDDALARVRSRIGDTLFGTKLSSVAMKAVPTYGDPIDPEPSAFDAIPRRKK
ncbi:MAG: hypothetical protein ACHQCG_01415 [Solirubrobacterales bacterium]